LATTDINSKIIDELIDSIYEGAMQEKPWQTFMPLFRQLLDADGVSLILRPPAKDNRGLILNSRRDQQQSKFTSDEWPVTSYKEHFFALDPFINLPIGQIVSIEELVPAEKLLESEYYINYLKPAGIRYILGGDVKEPTGLLASIRVMRSPDENAFSNREVDLFSRILPHITRAIQIHARLGRTESERDLYAGAVNQLAVSTIVLDEKGLVLNTNKAGTELLKQKDGISVLEQHIQLTTRDKTNTFKELVQKVLTANEHSAQLVEAIRIERPSGKPDLAAILRPVPLSQWAEGQQHPSLAVFISDPEHQNIASREILASLFGFSKAESALAVELAKGLTLAESSEELNISQHTARAQLKAIFAKADVSRQAELIRLLLKSVASLA
jgi:DNA-binding CsgD family transcriptional regulator